jgi:hypothetical protein
MNGHDFGCALKNAQNGIARVAAQRVGRQFDQRRAVFTAAVFLSDWFVMLWHIHPLGLALAA